MHTGASPREGLCHIICSPLPLAAGGIPVLVLNVNLGDDHSATARHLQKLLETEMGSLPYDFLPKGEKLFLFLAVSLPASVARRN